MEEGKKQKFGFVEMVLVCFMVTIPLDIIAIVLDIFTVDTSWIIQIGTWLIFTFYFTLKGCKVNATFAKRFLLPIAATFLPDWLLPFQLTILFLMSAYLENHPEKFLIVQTLSGETALASKTPRKLKSLMEIA